MRGRFTASIAVALWAVAGLPAPADACSCVANGPPCQEFWKHAAVFVGRVVSIDVYRGNADALGNRVVRLETLEAFRGVTSSTVEVVTGSEGGDCGYPFKVGERYVVYAYRSKDGSVLGTGICTRTRPVAQAAEDLAYARAVATSTTAGATVMGTVQHGDRPSRSAEGEVHYAPLPGVSVVIERDGVQYRAVADATGRFAISGLAAGSYSARAEVPDTEYADVWPRDVTIEDSRGCAEVTVVVRANGRASGRVIDSRGRPIAALTVGLLPEAAVDRGPASPDLIEARTDNAGRYVFSRVPAGRYVIGVGLQTAFDGRPLLPRIFHPGVGSAAQAAPVDLDEGQRVRLADFVLPPTSRVTTIRGRVVTEQDRPAAGATVYLHGETDRTPALAAPALTDATGRFSIAVLQGQRYSLVAELPRPLPEKSWNVDRGQLAAFTAAANLASIRIVVRPVPQQEP